MKILFYIDEMSRGGAQRVMSYIVNHYCNAGEEVVVVNDFSGNKANEFPISERAKRVYLRKCVSGNAIVKNIERIIRLRRILINENPQVAISFLGNVNLRLLVSSIGLSIMKCVSVRNDPYKEYGNNCIKRIVVDYLFRLADGIVFQTNDACNYFSKKVQSKSIIILNPINESFYQHANIELRRNIVAVGRLEKQKNHKLLIQAFGVVKDEYPRDNLLIFGDGILRDEIGRLIFDLELGDRVFLCGNKKGIADAIKNAKCFVMTSDYEGLPNALMEAMALGIPVISTDCPSGGPRTLIRSENEGVLVPVGSKDYLVQAIRKVLSDSALQKKMSIAERERAKEFRADRILKEWDVFLAGLIKEKGI